MSPTRAEMAASTPSADEESEASTCGFNSGFLPWARLFTTSFSPNEGRAKSIPPTTLVWYERGASHILGLTAPYRIASDWDIRISV